MSKKPVTDPHKAWNIQHYKRLEQYNKRIEKLLNDAIGQAALIVGRHNGEATEDHIFSFSDDRQMKAETDKLMKELAEEITQYTKGAETKEWETAYKQAVEYIGQLYEVVEQTQQQQNIFLDRLLVMKSRNMDALESFQKRKIGGLKLSSKVWDYTKDFERQMEAAIDTALLQGKSAEALSRDIRSLLKDPDALFRRVRGEDDQLRMSKAMEAFHPGPGKYRSAYKNAMRLARSEINMAYRSSDCDTAQSMDCVVGIRVNLSNNHTCNGKPFVDICDELSDQNYPKYFIFRGWHPMCRCFITYILKTDEEFWRDLEDGVNRRSVNTVDDVPDAFKEWVGNNEERIARAEERGTLPYFLRDNKVFYQDRLNEFEELFLPKQHSLTFAELQQTKGWSISNSDLFISDTAMEEWFQRMPYSKLDISSFDEALKKSFSEIGIKYNDVYKGIDFNPNTEEMRISLYYDNNGQRINIIRKFTPWMTDDGDCVFAVEHALFNIPNELQGKGFSKAILSDFYEQYKKMGIDHIDLYANLEIGGYAWAKYGFSCSDGEKALLYQIEYNEMRHNTTFQQARKIIEDFYQTHEKSASFPMDLLIGYEWSKDCLLGTDWNGRLYLTDKKQVKIFENYLKH